MSGGGVQAQVCPLCGPEENRVSSPVLYVIERSEATNHNLMAVLTTAYVKSDQDNVNQAVKGTYAYISRTPRS